MRICWLTRNNRTGIIVVRKFGTAWKIVFASSEFREVTESAESLREVGEVFRGLGYRLDWQEGKLDEEHLPQTDAWKEQDRQHRNSLIPFWSPDDSIGRLEQSRTEQQKARAREKYRLEKLKKNKVTKHGN